MSSNLNTYRINAINSAFIKSSVSIKDSINTQCSEVAILGRSNVGKSSFINMLLNSNLAKSSSTPGKTRLINFFKTTLRVEFLGNLTIDSKEDVNAESRGDLKQDSNNFIESKLQNFIILDSKNYENNKLEIPLVIIDFPGFGYAKVDKKTRQNWDKNLSEFLLKRASIKLFCHLIDARHRSLQIDSDISHFLESILSKRGDYDILQIYTKADKLKKNELHALRKNGNLTISNIKKNPSDLQNIYAKIITKTLGCEV